MTNFKVSLNEQLKEAQIKAEYDALEIEFAIIQNTNDARNASKLNEAPRPKGRGI